MGAAMLNPASPKAIEQAVTAFISENSLLFISTSKQLFYKNNKEWTKERPQSDNPKMIDNEKIPEAGLQDFACKRAKNYMASSFLPLVS